MATAKQPQDPSSAPCLGIHLTLKLPCFWTRPSASTPSPPPNSHQIAAKMVQCSGLAVEEQPPAPPFEGAARLTSGGRRRLQCSLEGSSNALAARATLFPFTLFQCVFPAVVVVVEEAFNLSLSLPAPSTQWKHSSRAAAEAELLCGLAER